MGRLLVLWPSALKRTGGARSHFPAWLCIKFMADVFRNAPAMNPNRMYITGKVCGVRVEEIEDPVMREIRRLDKLVDELAKGKAMEQILRKG